jgi:hypothetical protein
MYRNQIHKNEWNCDTITEEIVTVEIDKSSGYNFQS